MVYDTSYISERMLTNALVAFLKIGLLSIFLRTIRLKPTQATHAYFPDQFSDKGSLEDLVSRKVVSVGLRGCLTNADASMHSVNGWQENLWQSEVDEYRQKGSYLNGTTVWINEFMALGHVPYDLAVLEVFRVTHIDRVILQRAPCDHPTLCKWMDPWESWFKGFYKTMISTFQQNATVYHRSYGREHDWFPDINSFDKSKQLLEPIHAFGLMCFDRVVRRDSIDDFYKGLSDATVQKFRKTAYALSNVTEVQSNSNIVITITHRGHDTKRHIENYNLIVDFLSRFLHPVIILHGKEKIPDDIKNISKDGNPQIIIRVVDTSNVTQMGLFEDQVRLSAESTIIIAEHGAFQTNMIFMRENALLMDLRGDYVNNAVTTFRNLAKVFHVHFASIVTKDMLSQEQQSFSIRNDEIDEIQNVLSKYFIEILNITLNKSNSSISLASDVLSSNNTFVFPEKYNNEKCMITTTSFDALGHQMEAKLSCIMLSSISNMFTYVHTPLKSLNHNNIVTSLNKEADDFFNFKTISLDIDFLKNMSARGLMFTRGGKTGKLSFYTVPAGYIGMSRDEWTKSVENGRFHCDPLTVYEIDNCWSVAYRSPYVERLPESRDMIRRSYFGTPKPDTRFVSGRVNTVVHIRRGDVAPIYQIPCEFYVGAMNYSLKVSTQPVFWLESDDLNWPGLAYLQRYFSNRAEVFLPNKSDDIFTTFHRMVMADNLIFGFSSLSNAAALISNTSYALVPTYDDGSSRKNLYNTKRYKRVDEVSSRSIPDAPKRRAF